MFLKISKYSQDAHLYWSLFLITSLKETPTQLFSCECFKIFKNNYFEEHLRMAAFDSWKLWMCLKCLSSRLWQNITVLVFFFSASLEFYSQCAHVLIKPKLTADRGRGPEMFFEKGILENLAKLRKTPVPESLFNKVSGR